MGCNTSQEKATLSVENDNVAATNADNTDVKNESDQLISNDPSNEIPMVNGDPLGKDEGKYITSLNPTLYCVSFLYNLIRSCYNDIINIINPSK